MSHRPVLWYLTGGFSKGLKEVGFPITKTYFSEIDKYAISVYQRNFPNAEYIEGVESVSGSRFKGRKTIITFGFPCQDLSIAGKRRGFDGSRSSLFFEAMRIVEEVRPSIFIFENVKGFYSSNNGKDFQIALQTIADLGLYECEWQLLNTAWFLPQNRERIYFVGHLGGSGGRKVFPVRESNKNALQGRQSEKNEVTQYIGASGNDKLKGSHLIINPLKDKTEYGWHFEQNVYDEKGITRALKSTEGSGNKPKVIIAQRGRENGQELEERKDGLTNTLTSVQKDNYVAQPMQWRRTEKGKRARQASQQQGKDYTPFSNGCRELVPSDRKEVGSLTSQAIAKDSLIQDKLNIRRLTPTEAEKLQGFPDGWTKYGHEGQIISDSQRYKMLGNAVSVPVVKCIGERL